MSEDDHIAYLAETGIGGVLPVTLAARLRRSHFLFLGYGLVDWSFRVFLQRLWPDEQPAYRSWAVQPGATSLERDFWRRRGVEPGRPAADEAAGRLREQLAALAGAGPGMTVGARGSRLRRARTRASLPFDDSDLDALLFFGRAGRPRSSPPTSRVPAHRAVRPERRREELAAARRSGSFAPRRRRAGARGRRLRLVGRRSAGGARGGRACRRDRGDRRASRQKLPGGLADRLAAWTPSSAQSSVCCSTSSRSSSCTTAAERRRERLRRPAARARRRGPAYASTSCSASGTTRSRSSMPSSSGFPGSSRTRCASTTSTGRPRAQRFSGRSTVTTRWPPAGARSRSSRSWSTQSSTRSQTGRIEKGLAGRGSSEARAARRARRDARTSSS